MSAPSVKETNAQAAERLGYRLSRRQEHSYIVWCDLYPPLDIDVMDDNQIRDFDYPAHPKFRNVPCFRQDSQEDNGPTIIGRAKGELVISSTVFKFALGQEIDDTWLIRFHLRDALNGGPFIDYRWYVVQGGPQDTGTANRRVINQRKLFATETIRPQSVREEV